MTRARDHLIVGGHHKPAGEGKPPASYAERLWSTLSSSASEPHCRTLDELRLAEDRPVSSGAAASGAEPVMAEPFQLSFELEPAGRPSVTGWISSRAALLVDGARPVSVSATELAREHRSSAAPRDTESRSGRGSYGTAVGSAVHTVLQRVDLAEPADLDELARSAALAQGVPAAVDEIRDRARSALSAAVVDLARRASRVWREVPVAAPVGEVLVEGFIDLLIETDDGVVIVDYKTDSGGSAEGIASTLPTYELQLAAYAAALQQATGLQVSDAVLLYSGRDSAHEHSIGDIDAAIAALHTHIDEYVSQPEPRR